MIPNLENKHAYLITFAEPSLTEFTKRLKEDVPQINVEL
ncbi:hypothetical protein ALON55S_07170 [Alishewanella longhuensis]